MNPLTKTVNLAGFLLLSSHFAITVTVAGGSSSVNSVFDPSKGIDLFKSVPNDPKAIPYSAQFEIKPHLKSELPSLDANIAEAESKLAKLSRDRGSENAVSITKDRLNWARQQLNINDPYPAYQITERIIIAAKEGIEQERKAYIALAQGDWEAAYRLIMEAAKNHEFSYLARHIYEKHPETVLYYLPRLAFKPNIQLDLYQRQRIQKALGKLHGQQKRYQVIPTREELERVIHHFNQLGYPDEQKTGASGLAKDQISVPCVNTKSALKKKFRQAAAQAKIFGDRALDSLAKGDRTKAMKLIEKLRNSRKKASDYYARYQLNGHGTIDLALNPKFTSVAPKQGGAEGRGPIHNNISSEQVKEILAKLT